MAVYIPLSSPPLLAATFIIALGVALIPLSARHGIICIGTGSVIMGFIMLDDLPKGFEPPGDYNIWINRRSGSLDDSCGAEAAFEKGSIIADLAFGIAAE